MDYYDVIELASELINFELNDDNFDKLEEEFYDKYEIGIDSFTKLLEDLIKFTPTIESPITKTRYHAFVKELGNGLCRAIIKEDI